MKDFVEAAIIATLCNADIIPNAIVKEWEREYPENRYIRYHNISLIWRDALKVINPEVLINAIKIINRDEAEDNFWIYEEYMDMDGLFDSMTEEEISNEFDEYLEYVKTEMIEELERI